MPEPEFILHSKHWQAMHAHLLQTLPAEGCGLLAGTHGRSTAVYPVENLLASPTRFRMEPHQQALALLDLEERGWDLLAIYHSHPAGPPHPSPTDVAEFYYPDAFTLIWSPNRQGWECRAFRICSGEINQADYQIEK